jgi:phosphoserine phosphatase
MGKGDIYRMLYPRYQVGQITLEELLTQTYKCWQNLKLVDLPKVYSKLDFNLNAKETILKVKEHGYKTALLTNIPTHLSQMFQEELKFDYISGNILEVVDNTFTGNVLEFHNNKLNSALKILNESGIDPKDAVHIGDNNDDAEVFKKVAFGITYFGNEAARRSAKFEITDLSEVIDILDSTA